jgi:Family of unknown function (DUF6350)
MVGTPHDRPAGATRAPGPEDVLTAAEAAHLAARQTPPADEIHALPPAPPQPADNRDTVRLPRRRPAPRRLRHAPLAVAAVVAATWAALLTYVPVAAGLGLVQLVEGAGSVGGTARLGLAGWLLGHGVPLRTPSGPLGLAPLTVAGFAAWRVSRAGVHATRAIRARGSGSPRRALAVAVAVGIAYGVLGLVAGAVVNASGPPLSPIRAGGTLAVFGAFAALSGALRSTGGLGAVAARTPDALRDGLRTGVVAALAMLGIGALLAGTAIAIAGGDAADTIAAYHTGAAGQAGITLICLAYAPNAAVWAAAYLIGPGFAIGGDTVVRATEVNVGALPAVPLVAGLPAAPLDGPAALALCLPLVAGAVAGWLLARRVRAAPPGTAEGGWRRLLGAAVIAGPVAGVLLGLAAIASAGPLGDGRLAEVGPVGWQVGAVSSGVMALGTLTGAAIGWGLLRRRG